MKIRTSPSELIRKRRSCRSFSGAPLDASVKKNLEKFLLESPSTLFGSKIRLSLAATEPGDTETLKNLGTYGFIRGASAFILGAVEPSGFCLEDYGYVLETCVLKAEELGLGSCWLGGSFNKSAFASRISCGKSEKVPAVIALGRKADKTRLFDSAARMIIGASKRKSRDELFFMNDFGTPLDAGAAGIYDTPLEMVRLAPSASNKQPWRIIKNPEDGLFHLFLQRTKNYYENNSRWFGMMDLQRVDMGIAMSHFELACREQGIGGAWSALEGGVAKVRLPAMTSYVATWKGDNHGRP